MKTGLFLLLLITGTAFGQSKKELKAQIASYQQKLDSTNLALEKAQHSNDSLSDEIRKKENALKNKQNTLENKTRELEILKVQMETLQSSKQEDPISKLAKQRPHNPNPFSTEGGSGSGNKNRTLGTDSGGRRLIKKPDVSAISSEESCTIVFQIRVDEKGDVIGTPILLRSSTTTSDEVLINKVSALVKSQAKYEPVKGKATDEKVISIRIYPH